MKLDFNNKNSNKNKIKKLCKVETHFPYTFSNGQLPSISCMEKSSVHGEQNSGPDPMGWPTKLYAFSALFIFNLHLTSLVPRSSTLIPIFQPYFQHESHNKNSLINYFTNRH